MEHVAIHTNTHTHTHTLADRTFVFTNDNPRKLGRDFFVSARACIITIQTE